MSAKHLNLSTVVDKNKIDSSNVFLILIEVKILSPETGEEVTTIRFVKNSENVTFEGNNFQAANFSIETSNEIGQEPTLSVKAHDETRTLAQYIDAYDGLVDSKLRMIVANSASLDSPPELDEEFLIVHASSQNYQVDMNLGVQSAVSQRFPNFRQQKDRCSWKYKGPRCKYAGAMTTCDYSRTGPNGCIAHDNEINFGGFPGISELF